MGMVVWAMEQPQTERPLCRWLAVGSKSLQVPNRPWELRSFSLSIIHSHERVLAYTLLIFSIYGCLVLCKRLNFIPDHFWDVEVSSVAFLAGDKDSWGFSKVSNTPAVHIGLL